MDFWSSMQRPLPLLWLLFITIVLRELNASFDSTLTAEHIDAAVNGIETADVLMSLNLLGPKTALLMKTIIPVGAVIVAEINPEPETATYKQLLDLNTRTNETWILNLQAIQASTRAIVAKITSSEYFLKVTLPLNIMKNKTDDALDPTYRKPVIFLEIYKKNCMDGEKAPEEMLNYLVSRLVTPCGRGFTNETAKEYATLRSYLLHVLAKLNVVGEQLPSIDTYIEQFMEIYEKIGDRSILHLDNLNVFDERFVSYKSAISAYFEELRRKNPVVKEEDENTSCLLAELLNGTGYSFAQTEAFVIQLTNQLIDLSFVAGVCANVIYQDDPESLEKYAQRVQGNLKLISEHVSNWLNQSLEAAWPNIHHQILKEQLVRMSPDPAQITANSLQAAMDLSLPKLSDTGSQTYAYQSVISKIAERNEQFFDGIPKFFSVNYNAFGFNVGLTRLPLNVTNKGAKGQIYQQNSIP